MSFFGTRNLPVRGYKYLSYYAIILTLDIHICPLYLREHKGLETVRRTRWKITPKTNILNIRVGRLIAPYDVCQSPHHPGPLEVMWTLI